MPSIDVTSVSFCFNGAAVDERRKARRATCAGRSSGCFNGAAVDERRKVA